MNSLLIKVKEQGIVDIIYDYKDNLEFKDILDNHHHNWSRISCQRNLPLEFLIDNQDKLNVSLISRFHKMTDDILEELKDYLDWDIMASCAQLTLKQSVKYSDYIRLDLLRIRVMVG